MSDKLFDFYCCNGKDHAGRTLKAIQAFNDDHLEMVHDYIQWLFPTATRSQFNFYAPVLDAQLIKTLKNAPTFHLRFSHSLTTILKFWGIGYKNDGGRDGIRILPIELPHDNWFEPGNHNLLRMARVMESCRLLGWENTAISLFEALLELAKNQPGVITPTNIYYWYRAAYGH